MPWSQADIAWMAGLFEGEGSLSRSKNSTNIQLFLGMTDEDVVRKFHQTVGFGSVYTEDRSNSGRKDLYRWYAGKRRDVVRFLLAVAPLLGSRRKDSIYASL